MGLALKPPSWSNCTSSWTGSNSSTTPTVVVVTAAGSANTKGTAVSLLTAIEHDVEYLVIGVSSGSTNATEVNILADILVDPAGGSTWNSSPLIPNLLGGFAGNPSTSGECFHWYHFPLWVPSGSSLGAQIQSSVASETLDISVFALGGNKNPGSWWCGQYVTAYGPDTATSKGVDHTPGNSGSFSAWANFGSTLSADCGAVQYGIGGSDSSMTQISYFWEFGIASTRVGPPQFVVGSTSESKWKEPSMPIFYSAAAGTQWQARAKASGTAEAYDIALYAVH